MAKIAYVKTALTGGAGSALDSIDGTDLNDGDFAFVHISTTTTYFYVLDVDSAAVESSPSVISPDTNAGNKRWLLQNGVFDNIELGHATDTTIARSGAGDITIEGNAVYRAGGTDVPVADGGTGASTLTDGGVLVGNGANAIAATAAGATTEILVGGGAGVDPVWTTATGTGAPVRAISPTLVTPNLGVATLGGDLSAAGYYALQLQNFPDLTSKGQGYWFDGVDDTITVANNADVNITTNDFSIIVAYTDLGGSIANHPAIVGKYQDNSNGWELRHSASGKFQFWFEVGNVLSGYYESDAGTAANSYRQDIIGFVSDRDGTKGQMYIDGEAVTTTENTAMVATTLINTGGLTLANFSTVYYNIELSRVFMFNLALTAAEVKALSNGAPVPYKYIGASQTELMPNQVDRDFSGASAWANVDINAYDETTDLTITATAANQYCTLAVASAPTTIGKRYRMTYDLANIASTWTVKDFTGVQTIGTISANATQGTLEWTATTTGGYRLVANSTTSSGDFDNFTLTQIGAVLQLEQSGIGHQQWIDTSGNELHGTVSGALPTNLTTNHKEKYIDLTVTGDTSFTLPMGYQLTSMTFVSDGSIGGGIDVGTTNGGGEVVTAMAVGAAGTFIATIVLATSIGATHTTADDIFYITDADGTGWDSSTVEVRAEMRRLGVM